MKVLITGRGGQLGGDLEALLSARHELLTTSRGELDITDLEATGALFADFEPDLVINCAAFTLVDACENERETAWRANVLGPENLAKHAAVHGARLIHISTDYVFDGTKPDLDVYLETDETAPISHYGATKLEGERVVMRASRRNVVLRTSWLYGLRGSNFLKKILRRALTSPGDALKVVDDQRGSPTWSRRLALQISEVMESSACGLFHASAEGHATWYQLARYFLAKMDIPHSIAPCTSEEYPTRAARPRNSALENRRLKAARINVMVDWRDDVDRFVDEHRHELLEEVMR